MNRLICTVGLPRSGKTTWAKEQGYPIVNPDSIRLALHGKAFEALAEKFVWAIAHAMVRALFLAGHDTVIVDGTNNTKKRRDEWQSKEWKTYFKCFNADNFLCKERAVESGREDLIPVIERMWETRKSLSGDESQIVQCHDERPWIGVDLDGTLAEYHGWQGPDNIGSPVQPMVERMLNKPGFLD